MARANHLPPKFMWGVGKSSSRWSELDLLLAEALALYEAGLCKGCGHPLAFTTDDHVHPLDFVTSSVKCAGCAAIKDNPEADKPASGQLFFVVNNSSHRY